MIEVKGLKKVFRTEAGQLDVLRGMDFRIASGEMVAIVGASGVGKSTLLHIMGALDTPTSGSVLHSGVDVFKMPAKQLSAFRNKEVGFVFQFHHLLPEFTARENIMIPALINGGYTNEEAGEMADSLMDSLGVLNRKTHRPGELSGGEQQRVAIARALILNPKAVFADEPTGNLDTATGEELFKLLMQLNKDRGTTFIIATHNERLSRQCSRVLEMVDGRIS